MKRARLVVAAAVVAAAVVAAAVVAGCGPLIVIVDPNMKQAKVTCASSPTSCRCENKDFSLLSEESPAQPLTCDTPLTAGVAGCCHDLDSSGKSTFCSCQKYSCWKEGGDCTCSIGPKPSGATAVASCKETPGSVQCCWGGLLVHVPDVLGHSVSMRRRHRPRRRVSGAGQVLQGCVQRQDGAVLLGPQLQAVNR
jgi:hypothetical protein